MKASIVLATYNRLSKLKRCLSCLLSQDFKDYEIIIVDDGSTDGTLEYLKKQKQKSKLNNKKIIFFTQQNQGPAVARNKAIKEAKGDVIFFTDDDVLVSKNWISKLLNFLNKHPEVIAAGGYLEAEKKLLKSNIFARYEKFTSELVYSRPLKEYVGGFETFGVVTNNAAYRRTCFNKAGYFDENFPVPGGEDADLKLRVSMHGNLGYIPLKATHIQDYTLKRFWNQQVARGIGMVYFENKWLNEDTKKNKKIYGLEKLYYLPFQIIKKDFLLIFPYVISVFASRLGVIKSKHIKKENSCN